jgi:hypothetical protein
MCILYIDKRQEKTGHMWHRCAGVISRRSGRGAKRKLIIRAEKITAFSHALRCDDIQQLAEARSTMRLPAREDNGREVPVCSFAPAKAPCTAGEIAVDRSSGTAL